MTVTNKKGEREVRFEAQLGLVRIPACPACGAANPRALAACPACGQGAPNLTDHQLVKAEVTAEVPPLARLLFWFAARLKDLAKFIERR